MHTVRVDKWLWAVRLYKTRSLAADACKAGKVKIDGVAVKPSRDIKEGDILYIQQTPVTRTVKVINPIKNRVGAKLVPDHMEDMTPQEEYDKLKMIQELNYERRDRGLGRPTKKERRIIDKLKRKE